MAEESALGNQEAKSESAPLKPGDLYDTSDYFLETLVRLANDGLEIGMTLSVDGFLVSGTLVGGKRYFDEHLAVEMVRELPEQFRESMTQFFKSFGKVYDPPEKSGEEEYRITYIHLRDARFFHHAGKPIPGNRAVWWRGRISQVGGFILGQLGNDKPS